MPVFRTDLRVPRALFDLMMSFFFRQGPPERCPSQRDQPGVELTHSRGDIDTCPSSLVSSESFGQRDEQDEQLTLAQRIVLSGSTSGPLGDNEQPLAPYLTVGH